MQIANLLQMKSNIYINYSSLLNHQSSSILYLINLFSEMKVIFFCILVNNVCVIDPLIVQGLLVCPIVLWVQLIQLP